MSQSCLRIISPIIFRCLPKSFSLYSFWALLLIQTMKTMHPTYNLKPLGLKGDAAFYKRLAEYTTQLLESEIPARRNILDGFLSSLIKLDSTTIRTPEEAYLEFLTLGVYLNNYSEFAVRITPFTSKVLGLLFQFRTRFPGSKYLIDKIKGGLSYLLLRRYTKLSKRSGNNSIEKLLVWLTTTGEFQREVERLNDWKNFIDAISVEEAMFIIRSAKQEAIRFSLEAKEILGIYLTNIETFLQEQPKNYRFREDYFFTARQENEYYLNWVGAEIINRIQREKFLGTTNKLLLLPTCMRLLPADRCKAKYDGKGLLCQRCNSNCNIRRIEDSVGHTDVKTYIISHLSSISASLKSMINEKDTGIIGVACTLNLLAGGYELISRKIPTQCVYLDYSGCKNHWHVQDLSIPTTLQADRLTEIIDAPGRQLKTTA
jgi:hypothetical protein